MLLTTGLGSPPIAWQGARRSRSAPEVPTVAESGYPGLEYANWNAFFAPAKTPAAIVARLNGEVVKILKEPDVAQRLVAMGAEPDPGPPDALARYMRQDAARWKKLIQFAGIRAE